MVPTELLEHAFDRSKSPAVDQQRGCLPGQRGHQTRALHLALDGLRVVALLQHDRKNSGNWVPT